MVAAAESLQAEGELLHGCGIASVDTSYEGTQGVQIPHLGEDREPRPPCGVVPIGVNERRKFLLCASETDALESVREINLARAEGGFVPVAEQRFATIPQCVAGIRIAVQESFAQREFEVPVGIQ
jgi:hypothetical protein